MPSLKEEKNLWKAGFNCVVGLDEAGRGSLAGPVVAAAVAIKSKIRYQKSKLKDSKRLTVKQREGLYNFLIKNPAVSWGIAWVSEKIIDEINILEATKLAMRRAIEKLKIKNKKLKIDFLILDGNFKIDLNIPQKSIIKADEKILSCAIASIIAKVTRDKMLEKYHKKYPEYGFAKHKGYPTNEHLRNLEKYKSCPLHRKSFKPVSNI